MEINPLVPTKTPPRKQANLVYSPHPICAAKNRQLHYAAFLPGESIATYLNRLNLSIKQPAVLHLNGQPIPVAQWQQVYPTVGDIITARGLVQGGGDGGSDPLRTVLTLAVLFAAPYAGAAIDGALGIGWVTSTAVSSIGGMLLVNALVPLPEPPDFGDGASPTYSLSGGSNRIRQFQPLPLIMGTHKVVPDLGAKPYTDFSGEDQYLYQCFNFGLSEVSLSNFKIGDTPLADYEINVAEDLEESGMDGVLTLFPNNVDSIAGGDLTHDGVWIQRTSSISTVSLALDFSGIIYTIKNQRQRTTKVILRFEYRLVGDVTWLPFSGADIEIINDDRNPVRETVSMDVPSGQYEVRGQYVKSQWEQLNILYSDNDNPDEYVYTWNDNPEVIATVVIGWSALKSFQPDDADYTGQKRVALRIKATGQLQGAVDQFNAIASASCPVWNEVTWVTQATSNPAWWYLFFARGKYAASGERLYGAGLADASIDIQAIKDWGTWCTSKGLTFDGVIDKKMSCQQVLKLIARCGRAAPTWATGKLGIIWDEANQPVTNMYGMSNIRRGSFQINYITKQVADEVIINFVNPANNWQPDTVRQAVPGVTNPQNPVTIDLFGCTNEVVAGKEANLIAAEQAYRRRQISWETDMEGLVNQRGDVVGLSHDLTQWGYSGRIVFGTTTVLMLDREVPFTPATSHYVGVRFPDGSYNIYDVVYQVGPTDTITLSGSTPLPSAPDNDPDNPAMDYLWFFAPQATPGKKVKITDIRPLSEHYVRITATDEDDAYYLAENDTYTYVPPATFGATLPTISNLDIGDTLVKVGTGFAVRIAAVWDVSGEYGGAFIRAARRNQPLRDIGKTLSRRFEFQWDDFGEIDIEVTLINLKGEYGTSSRSKVLYQVQGKDNDPSDVVIFTAQLQDFVIKLAWEPVEDIDIEEYEVRAGTDWATALFLGNAKSTEYLHAMVTAGTYDFLVKAKDTTKNESLNAVAAQIIIAAPNQPTVNSRFDGENFILSWAVSAGSFAVVEYEIRAGASWAAGDFVANIKSTSYSIRVDFAGTKQYWVAAIDAAGNFSAPSNINATINAPAQPTLTAEVIDNNVLLRWGEVGGTLPIKYYEIRRGADFATATVLQTVSGTFATFFENEAGAYIYWLVAVDSANNFGTEVSIATNVNEPPDYQLNVDWYSTFAGAKTNALLMENGDVLMPVETGTTYENHFINNGYTSPQDQINAGFIHFIQPSVNTAVYEEEFDYGTVLPATLVKAAFSKTTITGAVTIAPTISTRKLITDAWSDNVGQWLVFATDFRYVKVRLDIAASGGDDLLQGHSLNVRLDTKLKNDAGGGTANAGDVSGTPVLFNKTFIDVESITVSANTTASVTAVYDFLDAPNPTGFNVFLFNATTGARVSGNFSWSAKGF